MSKLIVTAKLYGDISDNVVCDIRWLLGFDKKNQNRHYPPRHIKTKTNT